MNKGTNKKKWILITLSIMIFAVGAYFYTSGSEDQMALSTDSKPMRKAKSVNLDDFPIQWNEAESHKDVEDFYEERIRGLTVAREKGLTVRPQVSTPIPEKDGRMQIHEVWHSGPTIHVLFSIDLSALTKVEDEEEGTEYITRPPSLENVRIKSPHGNDQQTFQAHSRPLNTQESLVYENRLYSYVQVPPITEKWGYNFEPDALTDYDKEFSTAFDLRIDHRTVQTAGMPVRYVHDMDKHVLNSYTSDETYSDDLVSIEPLELNLGITLSHMKVKIQAEHEKIGQTMQAVLKTDDGTSHPVSFLLNETEEKGVYQSWFHPPLDSINGDITSLDLESIHLIDDTPYSFNVDMNQFKEHSNNTIPLGKKVGEAYDTDIILDQADLFSRTNMNLKLKYEPHQETQENKLVGDSIGPMNGIPEERKSYVEIVTDEGEKTDAHIWGHGQNGDIHFQFPELRSAEEITVTIDKKVYAHSTGHTFSLTSK